MVVTVPDFAGTAELISESEPDAPSGSSLATFPKLAQKISAIVVTYRTGPRLRECLYALASDPEIHELIIVDNGNSERAERFLDSFVAARPHVTLDRTGENLGFGRGANRGARQATHPLLLFVNPDAVLKRGSAGALRAAAEDCTSPFIIGGRLFNLDGTEQRGPRRRKLTLSRAFGTFTGLARLPGVEDVHLDREPMPAEPVAMEVVSGALFLADRKGFLDRLGGFDEDYFLHVEDIDLCRRAAEAGGSVIYNPRGAALHYGSTSKVPRSFVERHKARGMARYFQKFAQTPMERHLARIAAPLFIALLVGRAKILTLRGRFTPWLPPGRQVRDRAIPENCLPSKETN